MTDFRALCFELHAAVQLYTGQNPAAAGIPANELVAQLMDAMANTAAALAQPEPQGPRVEALASFTAWFCRNYPGPDTIIHKPEWHAPKVFRAAESAIARWGRPAIEPVPVSERLPGPEDCDAEGRCWWWNPTMNPNCPNWWSFESTEYIETEPYWLPHWALPVPGVEGE